MPQQPPPRSPRDALAAFRARAGAILAEERGFTPACRVKLARVARELGLSDDQLEAAIRSLTGAPARAANPAAEKLRQRLKKDLEGRHKTIIGPEIEARVVAGATKKYGVDEATARQVLAEVAGELGLRHITGDQALKIFAESVEQAVGEGTWLAREAWDRLRSAGEKLGLSFEEADDLIEQKIAANRRASFAGRFWNRMVLTGAVAAVLLVGVTLAGLYVFRRGEQPAAGNGPEKGSTEVEEEPPKKVVTQPAWWDVDLAVAMATARREVTNLEPFYDDLRSDDPALRQKAYDQLVDLAASIDPEKHERQTVIDLIAGCHALDPDEACAGQLRAALLALVPRGDRPLSGSATLYGRAYWAVETALGLLDRQGMPAARAEALASEISDVLGTPVAVGPVSGESVRSCLTALTRVLYRHLTSKVGAQPVEGLALLEFLSSQARTWLSPEEIEKLKVEFLRAALAGAERSWRTFQPLMKELTESRDPLIVVQLLEIFQKATDRGLQQVLGEMLVRRTDARPRSSDPKQVARAVRQALGAAGVPVAQSAEDRWEDLRAAVEPVLSRSAPSSGGGKESLVRTIELGGLATQAMALAQGEPGFAIFDELAKSAEEPSEESEDEPTTRDRFSPPPTRTRPISPQERTQLARQIAQLGSFAEQAPAIRANAIRVLAARASIVDDVTYEQATVIARYLLAPKAEEELNGILAAVSTLSKWKQVRLAVVDHLPESKLKPNERQRLVSALLGYDVPIGEASSAALRQLLMRDMASELEGASGEGETAGADAAAKPLEPLIETYRQRARIVAVPAAEYMAAESPAAVLELVVRVLARRAPRARENENALSLEQYLELARYLGPDDPQRTVLLQRLILKLTAQRIAAQRPRETSAAEQVLAELDAADRAAPDLLAQLQAGERATLRMWMLYAVP